MENECYPSHFHVVKGSNGEPRRVTHEGYFRGQTPITIFDSKLRHFTEVGRENVAKLVKRSSSILI